MPLAIYYVSQITTIKIITSPQSIKGIASVQCAQYAWVVTVADTAN